MKILVPVVTMALLVASCAVPSHSRGDCGTLDTEKVRADLKTPFRTDREWQETLIKRLAWQLDCERMVAAFSI